MTEINIDDLYNKFTSDEQIKESFEKFTAPTGRYLFAASKVTAELASDKSPWPGREIVRVFGKLMDEEGKRKASVGFDASWDLRRTDKGAADRPSKLWGQLARALAMEKASVQEVINATSQYPFSVYVTEGFKTPEGWRTARDSESRSTFRKAGYEARNFVDSVAKVK